MLTAWIPLQDSDEAGGTLLVIDGSHRWPESEHLRGFHDPDLGRLPERLGRPVPAPRALRLERGQVSFHHMRTLHASSPNAGPVERIALAVHLQDGANRYRPFTAADGRAVVLPHDRLCRRGPDGAPDYADPEVFPELWPGPRGRLDLG
jgi:ectoine hydroxylase-related dioxygenase (phytanoyl-CoA dioxygenase family)